MYFVKFYLQKYNLSVIFTTMLSTTQCYKGVFCEASFLFLLFFFDVFCSLNWLDF